MCLAINDENSGVCFAAQCVSHTTYGSLYMALQRALCQTKHVLAYNKLKTCHEFSTVILDQDS